MFYRERSNPGLFLMAAVSIALTVPIIYYMQRIDKSLRLLSEGEEIETESPEF